LKLVVKLGDGSWLVSEQGDGESQSWHDHEFQIALQRWRKLDIAKIVVGDAIATPDLSRALEIGFTDLMAGGGSAVCSRLDWIELHGRLSP
jgi:hypothetical protein